MTSRPEGPKPYTGPVILPTGTPVDPLDPTKGNFTPVASAVEMTAAISELYGAANQNHGMTEVLGNAMQDGFADIGKLLEAFIHDVIHEIGNDGWISDDVQEFLDARQSAREKAEEEQAEALLKQEAVLTSNQTGPPA